MIDLHTHTFFSDGVLGVSELVYRAKCAGYKAIAITDHVDEANIEIVIPNIKNAVINLTKFYDIKVFCGVELTYVPPQIIKAVADRARELGADIIVVHGETLAESVPSGTNREAILAKVDILAHPGKITREDVMLAKENNVALEITTRRGHSRGNIWTAELAKEIGAKLVLNNDAHLPEDILEIDEIMNVLKNANLDEHDYKIMLKNSEEIINNIKTLRRK